jgi:hypothetical protein
LYSRQHRPVRENTDLFRLLPPSGGTLLFVDLEALRRAGFSDLIESQRADSLDQDSADFIRQTGFRFPADVRAVAARFSDAAYLAIRGDFNWTRIRQFLISKGGTCSAGICSANGGSAGQSYSVSRVQNDVALISMSQQGAVPGSALRAGDRNEVKLTLETTPNSPAWVRFGRDALQHPEQFPNGVRPLVSALGRATEITLSIQPASAAADAAFLIRLESDFEDSKAAAAAQAHLELQTKMMQLELARERKAPDPANLSGLLVSGRFEADGKRVTGTWPVRSELIETLRH